MLLLTSTGDLVTVTTSGATVVQVHASFVDQSSPTTFTPTRLNTSIVTATVTTVVTSPAGSTQRNVKYLSIQNTDASASNTITVIHTDGVTPVQIFKATLLAGWTASYNDLEGWFVVDAGGGRLVTPLQGRFLKESLVTSGTTFQTGPSTNTLKYRIVGGGGQGGGAATTTGSCGSGGAAGSYAEGYVTVTPNTTYTISVGAGGTTGAAAANGQAGGNTTLIIGATTITAPGGGGGLAGSATIAVAQLGGAPGAVATNGTLNMAGESGRASAVGAATTDNVSGSGGTSMLGGGANGIIAATGANGNSAAAIGFGGGGGGAASAGTTARAGGAGAGGALLLDELS